MSGAKVMLGCTLQVGWVGTRPASKPGSVYVLCTCKAVQPVSAVVPNAYAILMILVYDIFWQLLKVVQHCTFSMDAGLRLARAPFTNS